ncbi:bidirectional sugar transporter SWEET3-like [Chenopodium quinoa]|uniref:Bidirectional sugar transporter SWEET n=1 Tax=Chenopodium quinoa TaxID=63459 RepID=A0A803L2Q9_CHEQI|nr:bidirectional sugar transporter SWEET3-like [Chenopodium quinoa]
MGDKLRIAVGILGNLASALLYASPILTFSTVIKKKSTQGFSYVPYSVALLNALIYTWYSLPIVSKGWENFSLITVNGLGFLLESSYVLVYLFFSSPKGKVKVAAVTLTFLALFVATALISAFLLHDHHKRKVFVGSTGLITSTALYGAPLIAVKQVITTKSVEFMPFSLSLFTLLASCFWGAYGLLSHDLFIMSPNLVGILFGILQLVVYWKYKGRGIEEDTNKWDIEKNKEKPKQVQQLVTEDETKSKN